VHKGGEGCEEIEECEEVAGFEGRTRVARTMRFFREVMTVLS
jgi:hypothetical protein